MLVDSTDSGRLRILSSTVELRICDTNSCRLSSGPGTEVCAGEAELCFEEIGRFRFIMDSGCGLNPGIGSSSGCGGVPELEVAYVVMLNREGGCTQPSSEAGKGLSLTPFGVVRTCTAGEGLRRMALFGSGDGVAAGVAA